MGTVFPYPPPPPPPHFDRNVKNNLLPQIITPLGEDEAKKESDQCAKKVVSDSLGVVDLAIGLVNSVFNLPNGQVMFFEEFKL